MSRSPSREDPLVRSATTWLGGPIGRCARLGASWWTPVVVLFLVTTATFAVGMVQKGPCHEAGWPGDRQEAYTKLCYSDIAYLYRERGFADGNRAYVDRGDYPSLEYPVLTGAVMQVAATVTHWIGNGNPDHDSVLFFDLTVVILFGFALLTIWLLSRIVPSRPYDAMFVAAAPTLALAGTINWDLVAVALTTAALFAWARNRPALAGVLIGLGVATKFYPLLLLGPLLLLAWRARRLPAFFQALFAAAAVWLIVNLPILVLAPQSWQMFWSFNEGRAADFGSLWYVMALAGHPVGDVNTVSLGGFALACAGIAALALFAPTRPRLGQLAFLTVAAFLLVNKVYSPQYILWLLPLVALARPKWRDWLIWQAAEVFYWVAIWLHLGQHLFPPVAGTPDRVYWLAVVIRLLATAYLCVVVVRDILVPADDVVRANGAVDDPIGGPFDRAPDNRWQRRRPGSDARPGGGTGQSSAGGSGGVGTVHEGVVT